MTTDWNQLARARALEIPKDELALIVPVLESLEKAFRPLLDQLLHDTEPCYLLSELAVLGR